MECSIGGCTNKAVARGWCPKHWMRWRHHGDPNTPSPQDLTTEQRFWSKVDKSGECWLWTAAHRGDGYGAFQVEAQRQISAHRYSYELHHGRIAGGLVVMHSCDQPLCVNPDHLSLGTNAENAADSARKARRPRGAQNHNAKVTEENVVAMRRRYAQGGITHAQLAAEFKVSPALVSAVLARKAWRHI